MRDKICETSRKGCYSNKAKAEGAANFEFKIKGVLLNVYKCDSCHYWHLTSNLKPYKKRQKKVS